MLAATTDFIIIQGNIKTVNKTVKHCDETLTTWRDKLG